MISLLTIFNSSPKCIVMERLPVITLCTHPVTMTGSLPAPYFVFWNDLMLRFIYVYLEHSKSLLSWRLSSGFIRAGVDVISCLLVTRTANADIMLNYQTAVCGIREYRAYVENFWFLCVWFYGNVTSLS